MKKILFTSTIIIASVFAGIFIGQKISKSEKVISIVAPKPRPLDKYTIENLAKTEVQPAEIKIERMLAQNKNFTSYIFSFNFDPTLENKNFKKVSGLINIPNGTGPFPLILMIRGYVDQKAYVTGEGTSRAGEYFAKNGFMTIAPDFLGYGESDPESSDIFESRFQTYTTVLTLLKSIENLSSGSCPFPDNDIAIQLCSHSTILLWAHSNGGQIALTTLEITGANFSTVLWAPVSKPFPYSILYYTDESDDGGKLIRRELAKFEEDYDTDLYSLTKYLDRIKAPLQIHQGTADDAVPVAWTDSLVKNLQNNKNNKVNYYKYQGADHNLMPAWNTVVERNIEFFKSSFSSTTTSP
jgi:dienelactone hydrolase